jgi:hypothetical protein
MWPPQAGGTVPGQPPWPGPGWQNALPQPAVGGPAGKARTGPAIVAGLLLIVAAILGMVATSKAFNPAFDITEVFFYLYYVALAVAAIVALIPFKRRALALSIAEGIAWASVFELAADVVIGIVDHAYSGGAGFGPTVIKLYTAADGLGVIALVMLLIALQPAARRRRGPAGGSWVPLAGGVLAAQIGTAVVLLQLPHDGATWAINVINVISCVAIALYALLLRSRGYGGRILAAFAVMQMLVLLTDAEWTLLSATGVAVSVISLLVLIAVLAGSIVRAAGRAARAETLA